MYRYGQLSILGIHPADLEDDVYTLLASEEVFSRLVSYKELIDRRPQALMDADRAFSLIYNITEGTHTKKLEEASKAAMEVTPIKDESFS